MAHRHRRHLRNARRRRSSGMGGAAVKLALVGGVGYLIYSSWDAISSGISNALTNAKAWVTGEVQSGEEYVENGIAQVEGNVESGINDLYADVYNAAPSFIQKALPSTIFPNAGGGPNAF